MLNAKLFLGFILGLLEGGDLVLFDLIHLVKPGFQELLCDTGLEWVQLATSTSLFNRVDHETSAEPVARIGDHRRVSPELICVREVRLDLLFIALAV